MHTKMLATFGGLKFVGSNVVIKYTEYCIFVCAKYPGKWMFHLRSSDATQFYFIPRRFDDLIFQICFLGEYKRTFNIHGE